MPPNLALPIRARPLLHSQSLIATTPGVIPLASISQNNASCVPPPACRAFSATAHAASKTISIKHIPQILIPPYPYGPNRIWKVADLGLYGGAAIQSGNVNGGRKAVKVKRTWRPNVQPKQLWSQALGAWVDAKLTLRVFRTIRKEGGVDEYVLKDKTARIKELGEGGWKLRWLVMQSDKVRKRLDKQRRALGLALEGDMANKRKPNAPVIPRAPRKEGAADLAMDFATPGKITLRNRERMARLLANMTGMEEFCIGAGVDTVPRDGAGLRRGDSRLAPLLRGAGVSSIGSDTEQEVVEMVEVDTETGLPVLRDEDGFLVEEEELEQEEEGNFEAETNVEADTAVSKEVGGVHANTAAVGNTAGTNSSEQPRIDSAPSAVEVGSVGTAAGTTESTESTGFAQELSPYDSSRSSPTPAPDIIVVQPTKKTKKQTTALVPRTSRILVTPAPTEELLAAGQAIQIRDLAVRARRRMEAIKQGHKAKLEKRKWEHLRV